MTQRTNLVAAFPVPKAETVAQRVRQLQAEASELAACHIGEMRANIEAGIATAAEVAAGGAAYPEGVRQLAEKVVRDGASLLLTLDQITARAGR